MDVTELQQISLEIFQFLIHHTYLLLTVVIEEADVLEALVLTVLVLEADVLAAVARGNKRTSVLPKYKSTKKY
jgi:hypothetical protein